MGPYYQQPPFTSHSSGQSYQGNTFGWSSPAPYGVPRPMAGSVDSGSSIRPWNKPPALGFQSSLVRPSTLIPGSTSSGYPAPSASLPQSSVPGSSQMTVSRYEPIGITHRSLSSDEVAAWFCSSCNSPMICRVRLSPCFHLVCTSCFMGMSKEQDASVCRRCGVRCSTGEAIHKDDAVAVCSGSCYGQTKSKTGRAFLNTLSLKIHELYFHSSEQGCSDSPDMLTEQVHVNTADADSGQSDTRTCFGSEVYGTAAVDYVSDGGRGSHQAQAAGAVFPDSFHSENVVSAAEGVPSALPNGYFFSKLPHTDKYPPTIKSANDSLTNSQSSMYLGGSQQPGNASFVNGESREESQFRTPTIPVAPNQKPGSTSLGFQNDGTFVHVPQDSLGSVSNEHSILLDQGGISRYTNRCTFNQSMPPSGVASQVSNRPRDFAHHTPQDDPFTYQASSAVTARTSLYPGAVTSAQPAPHLSNYGTVAPLSTATFSASSGLSAVLGQLHQQDDLDDLM